MGKIIEVRTVGVLMGRYWQGGTDGGSLDSGFISICGLVTLSMYIYKNPSRCTLKTCILYHINVILQ